MLTRCGGGLYIGLIISTFVFTDAVSRLPADEVSVSCFLEDQFECEPGQCINATLKCNDVADCPSGVDEAMHMCGCAHDEFQCSDSCISLIDRCDLTCDCEPNCEDEKNCETFHCLESHLQCQNHFCIPHERWCDFRDDCVDNSDEIECSHRECWEGEFQCDNGQCIRSLFWCDSVPDCWDQSDESKCNATYFKLCADGTAVHQLKWCDRIVDCTDEVDEEDCTCAAEEYRCSNGKCIRASGKCNRKCDCVGCEDEYSCDEICDPSTGMICQFDRNHLYQPACVRKEYICDVKNDCGNWNDEYGCLTDDGTSCDATKFSHHLPCSRDGSRDDLRCIPSEGFCDGQPNCYKGADEDAEVCPGKKSSTCEKDNFICGTGQCLNITFRCDAFADCWDMSDEENCQNFTCPLGHWKCEGGHCITENKRCDFKPDCFVIDGTRDTSDEDNCDFRKCEEGEFTCVNNQCVPENQRCYLGKDGCIDGSHLSDCEDWVCSKGTHKCRNSYCVGPEMLCNRRLDCADWSDEVGCRQECGPQLKCECVVNKAYCEYLELPDIHLAAFETGITSFYLTGNYLNYSISRKLFTGMERSTLMDLSNNSISILGVGIFHHLWRLRSLYLNNNKIIHIQKGAFRGLSSLRALYLQGNGLTGLEPEAFIGLGQITTIDLSNQNLQEIPVGVFKGLHSLTMLNLSDNVLKHIPNGAFFGLTKLQILDISHNSIVVIDKKVFYGLPELRELYTDEFRFCCMAKGVDVCFPEPDEFSSCEDLMSNIFLRMCIWIQGAIAFIGNLVVIIWRIKNKRDNKVHSFLITNLAFGDFCMGMYLLIIASVDAHYRGVYSLFDRQWRDSDLCKFAGFLSTFSSELSVFSLTIITLHRLSSIVFPFRIKDMEFRGAIRVVIATWIFVVFLAGIPLVGLPYFGNFYGRSGVCLAFHITPDKPPGWEYSVFIFLVVNFITFATIAISYAVMFVVARRTQKAVMRSRDAKAGDSMARRMTLIVATDFLCWMPIILLGMASIAGAYVPLQVYAWIAVFVLPVNAAINPIMYTLITTPYVRRAFNRARTSLVNTSYSMSMDTKNTNVDEHRSSSKIPNGRKGDWTKGRNVSSDSKRNVFKLRQMHSTDLDGDDSSKNIASKTNNLQHRNDNLPSTKRSTNYTTCSLSDVVSNEQEQEKVSMLLDEKNNLTKEHCV